MSIIYEHSAETPLAPGETDGMEEFMRAVDEPTETDWDIGCEEPPHAFWAGAKVHPAAGGDAK